MELNIEQLVKDKVEEVDVNYLVRDEIQRAIKGDIARTIKTVINQEISATIRMEIDIALGGPIKTDDGWGKRAEYSKFEDLFKKLFAERLNSQWDMKRTIEKVIKDHTAALFNNHEKQINKFIIEKLTENDPRNP